MPTRVYQEVSAQTQREQLILNNLPLVRHILGRLSAGLPHGMDLDNLEAAGVLGLVEAANRFEPERGIRFKTFAYTRIRGAIYDELRRNSPFPQELLEKIAKVRKLLQSLPPPVSVETLALHSGLSADDVTDCLAAIRLSRHVSWDNLVESGNKQLTASAERPDFRMEDSEQKRQLVKAIAQLPDAERLAITLYYLEDLRLKEIGQVLQLSESRVSRLLTAAKHQIAEFIRSEE